MNNLKITVGGSKEDEAARSFVDAWHRAERGDSFHERRLTRALAKALGRDYSNVHADVQALTKAGLLDAADGGVRAEYGAIETRIAI